VTRRHDKPDIDATNVAVALRWEGQNAPRVTAKGEDELARRIVEAAETAGITRYPDPELAGVLARIPLGDEVPEALYRAVAEVIAFAYWVTGRWPDGWPGRPGTIDADDAAEE
jgi:flagellar biosynthesis protein